MADTLTGYGVHKLANRRLKQEGLKEIPPQMVYSYIRSKAIPTVDVGDTYRVTREAAEVWVEKFVAARKLRRDEALKVETEEVSEVSE